MCQSSGVREAVSLVANYLQLGRAQWQEEDGCDGKETKSGESMSKIEEKK